MKQPNPRDQHANSKANQSESSSTRLIPLTAWPDFHPWPSVGGLRHLVFHAGDNGFEFATVRIGRRVLIDEAKFFMWATSNRRAA